MMKKSGPLFWGPWGHRPDVMPLNMNLQLPKNNWKDVYGALGPC